MAFIEHGPCVNPNCSTSDGFALYDDGDRYGGRCYVCNKGFSNDQIADSPYWAEKGVVKLSKDAGRKEQPKNMQPKAKERKPVITTEKLEEVQKGVFDATGYRGLSKQVNEKYGVYTTYESDGSVATRAYPSTENQLVVGYKMRKHPKDFFSRGRNDAHCDLFGQNLWPTGGYRLLIVGGEEDAMAAYEMLRRDQLSRGKKEQNPVAVVSPSVGETSAFSQAQHHYEWFDKFEEIVVMMDSDEAGQQATASLLDVLPAGKVKVATLPSKDPNKMLIDGEVRQFIQAYWDAKKVSPAGVIGSGGLYESMLNKVATPKVSFPPFMKKVNKMTAGGIPLKSIVNIIAGSGIGKTTWVNELSLHWIFNTPYKVGVCSLEADTEEYGDNLLSAFIGKKMALFEDPEELEAYLRSPEVEAKANELFTLEDGSDRFHMVDDQGDTDSIMKKIEQMIIGCGVQIIIIDPLSDLMAGMDIGEQELFMSWQKKIIKRYAVIFVNVNHTRKGKDANNSASRGAEISEEDIIGTSTIYKSGRINITLRRNKHAADAIERNTTDVEIPKNRSTGITGPAGQVYYEIETHKLHNSDEYWSTRSAGMEDIPDYMFDMPPDQNEHNQM